jgi:hypothetical protein
MSRGFRSVRRVWAGRGLWFHGVGRWKYFLVICDRGFGGGGGIQQGGRIRTRMGRQKCLPRLPHIGHESIRIFARYFVGIMGNKGWFTGYDVV